MSDNLYGLGFGVTTFGALWSASKIDMYLSNNKWLNNQATPGINRHGSKDASVEIIGDKATIKRWFYKIDLHGVSRGSFDDPSKLINKKFVYITPRLGGFIAIIGSYLIGKYLGKDIISYITNSKN